MENIESITLSQINQMHTLKKNALSNSVKIVTLHFDNEVKQKFSALENNWNINLKDIFVNIYQYFRYTNLDKTDLNQETTQLDQENHSYTWMKSKHVHNFNNQINYFKKEKTYDDTNTLRSIKYFDKHLNLVRFEELDISGLTHRVVFFHSGLTSQELYYREDGSIYLIKNKIKDTGALLNNAEIILYDANEDMIREFDDHTQFHQFFLDMLVGTTSSFILFQDKEIYNLLQDYIHHNVFKIYYKKYFSNTDDNSFNPTLLDGVIFSTETDKQEVINTYGNRNNYFVIPPFLAHSGTPVEDEFNKEQIRFVVKLAEDDIILLEKIIRAFRIAIDKKSTGILDICGTDILNQTNIDLIESLGLNSYVNFYGKIENMEEIYHSSHCSLFLNEAEDNQIDILQSLAQGCPVISTTSNYFANEVIANGVNGFTVDQDSIKHISEKMIDILTLSEQLETMKKRSVISTEKYNQELFLTNWSSTASNIIKNKKNRTLLTDMSVYMEDGSWSTERSFYVKSKLLLEGKSNSLSIPSIYIVLKNRKRTQIIPIYGTFEQMDELSFFFTAYIDFPTLDLEQDIWDSFVNIEWENSFLQKRLYIDSNEKVRELENNLRNDIVNNRVIKPYPTILGSNLSFNVGRFIPEKEELIRLRNKFNI